MQLIFAWDFILQQQDFTEYLFLLHDKNLGF